MIITITIIIVITIVVIITIVVMLLTCQTCHIRHLQPGGESVVNIPNMIPAAKKKETRINRQKHAKAA
jgi:hypothetical protein